MDDGSQCSLPCDIVHSILDILKKWIALVKVTVLAETAPEVVYPGVRAHEQ